MLHEPPQRALRVGLVGSGIGESLSPALHEHEARAIGIDYGYELIDLDAIGRPPEAIGELLAEARADGFRGLNVTHPCKQLVVEHVDDLSRQARVLGSANTILFEPGRTTAHNTDWSGFAEGFRRGLPGAELSGVVLVGAGGAGRAVAHAALELGAERLHVIDAEPRRAADLAAELGSCARPAGGADLPTLLRAADGIIHATPTGMVGHPGIAVDPELLHDGLWVAEVVYRPLETSLVRAARDRGCRTLDGGRMAVFQAVHAFELFTGRRADPERMLDHFARLTSGEATSSTRA